MKAVSETAQRDNWDFANSFSSRRRSQLEAWKSFDAIICRLLLEMSGVRIAVCKGKDPGLQQSRQCVFTFEVQPDTFDAFFNSPVGYRAQYLRDPDQGQSANSVAIARLTPQLLSQDIVLGCGVPIDEISHSLRANSAKIWIDEQDFVFLNPPRDLAINSWMTASEDGHDKANWGLHAPTGVLLNVKTALIDAFGNEIVPRCKVDRRFEIAECGYS